MNRLVNEEIESMKYLLKYERGRVISEQANVQIPRQQLNLPTVSNVPTSDVSQTQAAQTQAAQTQAAQTQAAQTQAAQTQSTPKTLEDMIKQVQTVLKTKFGANLGTSGPNKDGIDGKWGNITQTALDNAIKAKSAKNNQNTQTGQVQTGQVQTGQVQK